MIVPYRQVHHWKGVWPACPSLPWPLPRHRFENEEKSSKWRNFEPWLGRCILATLRARRVVHPEDAASELLTSAAQGQPGKEKNKHRLGRSRLSIVKRADTSAQPAFWLTPFRMSPTFVPSVEQPSIPEMPLACGPKSRHTEKIGTRAAAEHVGPPGAPALRGGVLIIPLYSPWEKAVSPSDARSLLPVSYKARWWSHPVTTLPASKILRGSRKRASPQNLETERLCTRGHRVLHFLLLQYRFPSKKWTLYGFA